MCDEQTTIISSSLSTTTVRLAMRCPSSLSLSPLSPARSIPRNHQNGDEIEMESLTKRLHRIKRRLFLEHAQAASMHGKQTVNSSSRILPIKDSEVKKASSLSVLVPTKGSFDSILSCDATVDGFISDDSSEKEESDGNIMME